MRSCLIVGAQGETRVTVRDSLARRRFEIREVESADEALDLCRREMPDVVVFDDAGAEDGDRFAFLRRLRRTKRGIGAVVLYCSGGTDPAEMGTAIVDGASDCLVKPFDADLLEFKLEQAGLDIRAEG